jgi:integrase
MAALDEGQTAQVMNAANTSIWNVPIFVAATTGLRRGEVLALRWKDVDLERARVHITQVAEQTKAGLTFKEPKTDKSRRAVTLPSVTVEAFKRHWAAQAENRLALGLPRDDNALAFTDADGQPLKPSCMTKSFTRILGKAKTGTRVSLHGLRHGHASHLLKRDTNPKIVSERLGHASVAITLDLYSHVLPGLQEDTAKVVDLAMRTALQQTKPKGRLRCDQSVTIGS